MTSRHCKASRNISLILLAIASGMKHIPFHYIENYLKAFRYESRFGCPHRKRMTKNKRKNESNIRAIFAMEHETSCVGHGESVLLPIAQCQLRGDRDALPRCAYVCEYVVFCVLCMSGNSQH